MGLDSTRESIRLSSTAAIKIDTDALEARLAAEKLLREHPEINVLIGFNEPLAVGVAQAVDSLGLTGQVHAVSFDSNVNCIELLQTGAKKKKDADRVVALYGDAEDRYW